MADCNWDPAKHGGKPCPVHGAGGSIETGQPGKVKINKGKYYHGDDEEISRDEYNELKGNGYTEDDMDANNEDDFGFDEEPEVNEGLESSLYDEIEEAETDEEKSKLEDKINTAKANGEIKEEVANKLLNKLFEENAPDDEDDAKEVWSKHEGNARESKSDLKEDNDEESKTDKNMNLKKYGFVRSKEDDFSDDGNRFTTYFYDPEGKGDRRIELSKLNKDGQSYLYASYHNPKNRKYKSFDSLNGVPYVDAVKGLPQLKQDIDNFLEKEIGDYEKVTDIDEADITSMAQKAADLMKNNNMSKYDAIKQVIKDAELDYDSLSYSSSNSLEQALNQVKPYDREKLKKDANEWLKSVQKLTVGGYEGYGRNQRWRNSIPVEDAVYKMRNSYPINEYPDSVKEKLQKWALSKLNWSDFSDED